MSWRKWMKGEDTFPSGPYHKPASSDLLSESAQTGIIRCSLSSLYKPDRKGWGSGRTFGQWCRFAMSATTLLQILASSFWYISLSCNQSESSMKALLLIHWDQALSRKGARGREKMGHMTQPLLKCMCGEPEGIMGSWLGGHGAPHWALGDWEGLDGAGWFCVCSLA